MSLATRLKKRILFKGKGGYDYIIQKDLVTSKTSYLNQAGYGKNGAENTDVQDSVNS